MKALNQLKTFQRILGSYPAETPLSKFLPGFYRQNKQMGSTDRKVASRSDSSELLSALGQGAF